MNWGSAAAFLAMGGYAGFIWGSYGITAACIATEIVVLIARHRGMRSKISGDSRPR